MAVLVQYSYYYSLLYNSCRRTTRPFSPFKLSSPTRLDLSSSYNTPISHSSRSFKLPRNRCHKVVVSEEESTVGSASAATDTDVFRLTYLEVIFSVSSSSGHPLPYAWLICFQFFFLFEIVSISFFLIIGE
jgi:hypothetical protein